MTPDEALALLRDDPVAQRLLVAPIPARIAYVARDGTPRVVPMGFHFTGRSFVLATVERAPKVRAIRANPAVALTIDTDDQPPLALLVRGTAEVTVVDGVVPEYLEASRRNLPPDVYPAFEQQVTALYDRMARIEVTPTWATVFDFATRAPKEVMRLAAEKGLAP